MSRGSKESSHYKPLDLFLNSAVRNPNMGSYLSHFDARAVN